MEDMEKKLAFLLARSPHFMLKGGSSTYRKAARDFIANGVVIRKKGEWLPCFIYTHHDVSDCLQGHDGWQCSICGESFDTRYDYCVCGADMRKDKTNE